MKKLEIQNGIQLSYRETGKGDTILLLHGFCGDVGYWDKVIETLGQTNHVLSLDLRGHGHSSGFDQEFSIEDMAKDVVEFLNAKEVNELFVFGHSLGGYITLALADQFLNRLKGFGLIHSTALPDSDEAKVGRDKAMDAIDTKGIKEFVNELVPKLFSDTFLSSNEHEVERIKNIGYLTNPVSAKGTLKAMKERKDRTSVLSTSSVPILLVAGRMDKIIPPEKVFSVESQNIKKVVMDNSGHMSMVEEPEKLTKTILAFVQGTNKH